MLYKKIRAYFMAYRIHAIDVKNHLQNYIWLLEHLPSQQCIVIDPTQADLVEQFCLSHQLSLKQIWLTHWHKDHTGGAAELARPQNIPVYGPREELSKMPCVSHPLMDADHLQFHDLKIEVIATPGHTLGHIAYFIDAIQALFCGDTLFAMGCGRLFEGTYEQLYHSLNRLAALPEATQVYCTHEYTLSNAAFALRVEPNNLELQQRAAHVQAQRARGEITLPSSIGLELQTNPFLRSQSLEQFTELRLAKDQF